jgi:hypothetical protein
MIRFIEQSPCIRGIEDFPDGALRRQMKENNGRGSAVLAQKRIERIKVR